MTVTALQFETYKEMETCLQEIVTRTTAVEEFVNAHRVNSIADLGICAMVRRIINYKQNSEIDPDNRAFAEIERQLLCPICWSAARDTALNCGHTYCRECADNLVDCANCRQRVTEKKRIYL